MSFKDSIATVASFIFGLSFVITFVGWVIAAFIDGIGFTSVALDIAAVLIVSLWVMAVSGGFHIVFDAIK